MTRLASALCIMALTFGLGGVAASQQSLPRAEEAEQPNVQLPAEAGARINGGRASIFMQVPVSHLAPGALPNRPGIKNPAAGDPRAAERGMTYFLSFNCVGCHAPNGGGGMGPALSNTLFTYGAEPENIYLSIYQGRPNGMPAWGAALPDAVIWDLVTYISKISNEPATEWGRTFSAEPLSPHIEQVPSQQITTTEPWSQTRNFSFGQGP
jgi:cytochrome c oxidase cbb3-type subunit III